MIMVERSDKTSPMSSYFIPGSLTFIRPELIYNSSLRFPLMVNIEPTNECNMKCFMCPRQTMLRKVGFMDFDLYKSIIDESIAYGGILVANMHKDGESCLHPKFPEMVDYAKRVGGVKITHLNTNGTVLNDTLILKLIQSGMDDITFSIDAVNPQTFTKIKGYDRLREVDANIIRFVELRDESKSQTPFLRAKIIGCDLNRDEIPAFFEKWTGVVDDVYVQEINTFGGWMEIEQKGHYFPCQSPWYALAVNWDGTVNLCSDDYGGHEPLGNLRNNSLHEIWVGDKMNRYRELLCEGRISEIPECAKCTRWEEGPDISEWLRKRGDVEVWGQ